MRKETLAGLFALLASVSPASAQHAPREIAPGLSAASADGSAESSRLTFANACAPGKRITIVAVGDLLFHPDLEREALTPTGSYRDFWQPVAPVLANADLTYGNFEGTSAEGINTRLEFVKDPGRNWNNTVYAAPDSQLLFNYHPSVAGDLKASGFDVVSTANNHALDRGPIGIERTIANLSKAGLAVTGTRPRDAIDQPFSAVTGVKGLNVAWLACAYATNGFLDQHSQVLNCFEQREQVLAEIRRLAAEPTIDAVILTPHWGLEGSPTPEQRQRDLARDAIEAGASAIIGTHPHVLQQWEKLTARDGHEGLVVYSTGNFISGQKRDAQRLGAMVVMELTKEPGAAKARVTAAGYVSTWVETQGPHRVTEAPSTMPSRYLPPGNRVFMAGLPKLPRDCDQGVEAAASWGDQPVVALATLPPAVSRVFAKARTGAALGDPGSKMVVPRPLPLALAVVLNHPLGAFWRSQPPTATEHPATRERPMPGHWNAQVAEPHKTVGSDDSARKAIADPVAIAKINRRPIRRRVTAIRLLATTSQSFVAKHD